MLDSSISFNHILKFGLGLCQSFFYGDLYAGVFTGFSAQKAPKLLWNLIWWWIGTFLFGLSYYPLQTNIQQSFNLTYVFLIHKKNDRTQMVLEFFSTTNWWSTILSGACVSCLFPILGMNQKFVHFLSMSGLYIISSLINKSKLDLQNNSGFVLSVGKWWEWQQTETISQIEDLPNLEVKPITSERETETDR